MKIGYINNSNISNPIPNKEHSNQKASAELSYDKNTNEMPNYKNYASYMVDFNGIDLTKKKPATREERYTGCLLGGAIGDAFGAKVENESLVDIRKKYGETGLRYIPKRSGEYKITDDTQMTLFTSEGLLKSYTKSYDVDVEPDYDDIYSSYLRWYSTQVSDFASVQSPTGLLNEEYMYVKMSPGYTCMTSLMDGVKGTVEKPVNTSPGNGGIMRVAPVGLLYSKNPELAFRVGVKTAALTHGDPKAYLPAGFQASLIAQLVEETPIDEAIEKSVEILKEYDDNEETLFCVEKAVELAKSDVEPEEALKLLGRGSWGHEALGISLYCSLKNPTSYKDAVTMAVNHDGDSDTTAAITGNIMGAKLGSVSIPRNWRENVQAASWLIRFSEKFCKLSAKQNAPKGMDNENVQMRRSDDRFVQV